MMRSSLESKIYILPGAMAAVALAGGARVVRKRRGRYLAVFAGLLVLAYIVYRIRAAPFQGRLFLATLRSVDWRWLAVPFLLMPFAYVGRAIRWQVMLRPLGGKAGVVQLTSDTAIGYSAVILLGRVGEVVRPY